jgi:hypothetical protein
MKATDSGSSLSKPEQSATNWARTRKVDYHPARPFSGLPAHPPRPTGSAEQAFRARRSPFNRAASADSALLTGPLRLIYGALHNHRPG